MDMNQLKQSWLEEARRPLQGWDFSYLDERCVSSPLPWDYRQWIHRFRNVHTRLLDMGTGGGEFLLSLKHPPGLISVTEGYAPNLELCLQRLSPLGITVREILSDDSIPYESDSFDLVINRHESFSAEEVHRVLCPGGFFVTQQVGGQNNMDLARRLLPDISPPYPEHHLATVRNQVKNAGLHLIAGEETFPTISFHDIGALVFFASVISWEFPGFSVESCFGRLLKLYQQWEQTGVITGTEHRFLIAAQKPL